MPSELEKAIRSCSMQSNEKLRLECYDTIAKTRQLTNTRNYIQPGINFLNSKLVVTAWEPEYSLTISDFVDLIDHATMENGHKVKALGWTKRGNYYVLHIMMQTPVEVQFLPRETDNNEVSMSLMKEIRP